MAAVFEQLQRAQVADWLGSPSCPFGELLHHRSSGGPEYELTGKAAPAPEADEGRKGGVPVVDPVVLVQMVGAGKPLPAQLKHK
jgi:hypothetical protein